MNLSAMEKPLLFDEMDPENDKVLVLIQLNGGNDGLNTLIPLDQYDTLAELRSTVILPENTLIPLTDTLSLHPSMTGFKSLYEDGKLGMVQSVGYPNQNRSHFRSMDIWQSGSPADETWTTGWLGRYFANNHPGFPNDYPSESYPDPFAITMGNVVSETCQGSAANFSLTLNDPFALSPLAESAGENPTDTPYGMELDFLRTTIAQSNQYAEKITEAAGKGSNQVAYPSSRLGEQLKNIALLISGGLQTKVYVASIGGFDTHANQVDAGDTTTGEHAALLSTLSEAMSAFQSDLQALGIEERVIGLTFSEFGRQIRSNFSLGTDHGTAAPLFVFGACANSNILGENPEISPDIEVQEGLPMQYDFRDVYGSILQDWFGLSLDRIQTLLHQQYQYLPVIQNCQLATQTEIAPTIQFELDAFPNPFRQQINIHFYSPGGRTRVSIFDNLGSELSVLLHQDIPAGNHQLSWNSQRYPSGSYYYRFQHGSFQQTKRIIKID
ncbi:MAG: hypothetical protein Sapg2KO_09550 [Saprospiraceae bacterium]